MSNSPSPDLARRLRDVCEPIAANVYFAPEAQARYAALGLTYARATSAAAAGASVGLRAR